MQSFFHELNYKLTDDELKNIQKLPSLYETELNSSKIKSTDLVSEVIVKKEYFEYIPLLVSLCDQFDCKPLLIRFSSNMWFKWHIDSRGAALNIPLNTYDNSYTCFKYTQASDSLNESSTIVTVKYKLGHLVLLNTRYSHCVFNTSENVRYVFSLGFPKHSYERIIYHIKSKNL